MRQCRLAGKPYFLPATLLGRQATAGAAQRLLGGRRLGRQPPAGTGGVLVGADHAGVGLHRSTSRGLRTCKPAPRFERKHDPSRVLALSDGVFAIIITLLVLDVHVSQLTAGQSLAAALREIRPSFVAFVISFVVAGMYWAGHRDVFGLIRRTDRGLVWLNLLYLLPLCLLPFGASLLGRFDREPVAVRIYGLVLVAIAVMRVVVWVYTTQPPAPAVAAARWPPASRRAGLDPGPGAHLSACHAARGDRAWREPGDLRDHAGAVLPQHHGPSERAERGTGVRGLHLTRLPECFLGWISVRVDRGRCGVARTVKTSPCRTRSARHPLAGTVPLPTIQRNDWNIMAARSASWCPLRAGR